MKANYQTDETGRILNVTTFPIDESAPIIDLSDEFDLSVIYEYRLKGGKLIHDPLPPQEPTKDEQIAELKAKLADTDYIVIKIAEGAATREEYEDVIAQRQEWREEINKLELI